MPPPSNWFTHWNRGLKVNGNPVIWTKTVLDKLPHKYVEPKWADAHFERVPLELVKNTSSVWATYSFVFSLQNCFDLNWTLKQRRYFVQLNELKKKENETKSNEMKWNIKIKYI